MNAEIIAIGSELLTPYRQDTNSLYLTDKLNQTGSGGELQDHCGRQPGESHSGGHGGVLAGRLDHFHGRIGADGR